MRVMTKKAALVGTTALMMSSAAAFGAEYEIDSQDLLTPKRTGICDLVATGGVLSQDDILANACAHKPSILAVSATSGQQPIEQGAESESLATVMQSIRQQQNGTTATPQPAVATSTVAEPTFVPATSRAKTDDYQLSSALSGIRESMPKKQALPAKIWFVGVYR